MGYEDFIEQVPAPTAQDALREYLIVRKRIFDYRKMTHQ